MAWLSWAFIVKLITIWLLFLEKQVRGGVKDYNCHWYRNNNLHVRNLSGLAGHNPTTSRTDRLGRSNMPTYTLHKRGPGIS